MRRSTITISGTYGGSIWMPAVTCAKRFHHVVAPDDTLRDAVLRVLNDGDFQSCSIAEGQVTFARPLPDRKSFQRTHRRSMELAQFPSVVDCMAPAEVAEEILCCFGEDE